LPQCLVFHRVAAVLGLSSRCRSAWSFIALPHMFSRILVHDYQRVRNHAQIRRREQEQAEELRLLEEQKRSHTDRIKAQAEQILALEEEQERMQLTEEGNQMDLEKKTRQLTAHKHKVAMPISLC
jgi:hypothetical protein